jgi:hypothetical protein
MTTAKQYELLMQDTLSTWDAGNTDDTAALSKSLKAIRADLVATGTATSFNDAGESVEFGFLDGSIFDANSDKAYSLCSSAN